MAKQLGSGSAFEQLNKFTGATSQRLLGGLAQTSSGAPIAGDSMGTPALSPQAAPVNTYIQAGKAELGGKPFMFDRPASPGPNNDLSNLAKALSGFNENLGDLGTYLDQRREVKTKENQAEAQSIAGSLATRGYVSFKEAIADVGSKVQSDPSLLPVYNQLRAAWPETQSYVNSALSNLAIQSNVVSLPSKVNALKTGVLGTPIKDLNPATDEWKQTVTELVLPKNADGRAIGNNSMSIVQAIGSQNAAQLQRYTDAADEKIITTHFSQVSQLMKQLKERQIGPNGAAQAYQLLEETLYNSTTPQNFEKYKAAALSNIGKILNVIAQGAENPDKFILESLAVLNAVKTGPAVTTGERPSLLGSFGVPLTVARFELEKMVKGGLNEKRAEEDRMKRQNTEDMTADFIKNTFTEDVMASPTKFQQARLQLEKKLLTIYGSEPELLAVANARLGTVVAAVSSARIAPIQQETFTREYEASMLGDIAQGKQRILTQYRNGNLSQEAFNELNRNYTQRQAGENRLNMDLLKDLNRTFRKRQEDAFGTSFYGDFKAGGISKKEELDGARERNDLMRRGNTIIQQSKGKDVSAELEALYSKAADKYSKAAPTPAAPGTVPTGGASPTGGGTPAPQAKATPEAYKKLLEQQGFGYGMFGGIKQNTPTKVNALNRQIKNTRLYDKTILIKQLDDLSNGKQLDDATKLIIKSSTVKPSEFFFNQMKNHNMQLAPGQEQRLLDLDNSTQVSTSEPATNAYPGFAMVPTATPVMRIIQDALNEFARKNPNAKISAPTRFTGMGGPDLPDRYIGGDVGQRLRVALIGKESGGNYEILNPDSGAIGIGQVMPANVPSWTAKHYGQRLTPNQYRYNRAAQDAVVKGQLQEYYNGERAAGRSEAIAIRRAASTWYSGNPNLYDNNRVQTSGGKRYPSIREYTMDILRRVQRGT